MFLNRAAEIDAFLCDMAQSGSCTFVADVEACVVVGLIGDELDPYSWTLADNSFERYLPAPARVEEHHRTSIQPAPQHQPAVTKPQFRGSLAEKLQLVSTYMD